jgi:predicted RNA-binding protein with PUA-like domain
MAFWLMKSEPDVFSFEDLCRRKIEFWDGVRNYQARNFMRDTMRVGDYVLFYHSNAKPSGIAGYCRVVQKAQPDLSAQNPKSPYFDAAASPQNPRWYGVSVGDPVPFLKFISLPLLRETPALHNMDLLKKGQRLSVMPIKETEFKIILEMGGAHLPDWQ